MAQTSPVTLKSLAPIISPGTVVSDNHGLDSPSIQLQSELDEQLAAERSTELSKGRTVTIIATLTGTTVVSSFSTGLLTVGLPRMAPDLNLPPNLLLWYPYPCLAYTFCTPFRPMLVHYSRR